MEVIQYVDPTGQTMVARWPSQGTKAIQLGSQLVVEESQQAVFFRDGKALDTFGPGRHTLATLNLPLLTRVLGQRAFPPSPLIFAVLTLARPLLLTVLAVANRRNAGCGFSTRAWSSSVRRPELSSTRWITNITSGRPASYSSNTSATLF